MGKLVKRSQRRAYYGVPAAESGTTTYTRMTKFTSLSKSKNPKTYSRQYVDEDAAIEDVVGYAESISYAFDEEVGNTVHADIANIADEEQLGEDAVREIIVVFLDQEGETSGSKRAVKRSYAVIPNGEGDKVEAYSFTGVKYFAAGVYLLAAGSSTHSMTCKSCTFAMQAQGTGISFGIADRCDFTDCNFMLDMPFTVEGGRRGNLFSYSGLEDCLMRGSVTLSGTGNNGLLYITDGNQPMKNCFIAVEFTNTSEYTINLYPVKATATSCIVSSLIGTGITYYNGDNVQYVTAAQGKNVAYLNSVGFPVTAGV